ncbi:nose resistant to fluoxetine protein 6-like [Sitodiplosis mosellana]|uniref:nose resistant to fluoxetine protein 6-like n=1 Tax=Sitodiplosis mosellana TaxID=263140 RepID=UPI0024449C5D|nr:nose resistant to fluoxetine protein 6-like [Sitodiplosis mosellana]
MIFKKKWILAIILTLAISRPASATVISNLNVIFETFGPLSMVRFFEFNDIGWNITEKCIKDMFLFLDGLHKDIKWAVKLYDASGYYAGSMYAGNNVRRGDPQLCRELNEEINIHNYQALAGTHNRTVYEDVQGYMIPPIYLPFRVQLVNARYKSVIESSPMHTYVIHQTACMPKSCNHLDLMQVMSYSNVSHLRNNLVMKNSELLDVRILSEKYTYYTDSAFYIFIGLTSVFLIFGLFGTILEHLMYFDVKMNLMQLQQQEALNANATQLANRLNQLTNCTRNYKNSESLKTNLNAAQLDTLGSVNLIRIKELKMEDLSSLSVDFLSSKCTKFSSDAGSVSIASSNPNSLRALLLAFSWRRNFEILFSDLQRYCISDVIEIAGLRVLCLLWILLVHVTTVLYYVSDNKMYKYRTDGSNLVQGILSSGSLAIDTHFFLCGVCVAHMFFNRMKNIDVEAICSCFDTLLHIMSMIAYKVLQSVFPYIAILLLLQMLMKHFYDFSIIDIPSMDHRTCERSMWRNILYIDQFYPLDERCMLWSWVLSIEVHCFVVACIILLILKNHPRFGIIIFSSFLISSLIANTTLRFYDHRPETKISSSLIAEESLTFFNGLYDKPWTRLSPYIFGICIGFIIYKIDTKLEISIGMMSCGWISCLLLVVALIFSKSLISITTNAMFSTIIHMTWSVIILWIIVASISKHRGLIGHILTSKYLMPLDKMTNCFLMVYPIITRIIILSSDSSMHLSIGLIITFFLGITILTIFASFTLYMIFQAPVEDLLRNIYNQKMKY